MAELVRSVLTGIACDKPGCVRIEQFDKHAWGSHLDEDHYAVSWLIQEGWSLWCGRRGRYTYCREHGPRVEMRRIW